MPLFYSPGWFDAGTVVKLETSTDSVLFGANQALAGVTAPITALRLKAGGDTAFLVETDTAAVQGFIGAANGVGVYMGALSNDTLFFRTNNTSRWFINTSGHFVPNTDNALDIGIVTTNRVRTAYVQTSIVLGTVTLTDSGPGSLLSSGGMSVGSSAVGYRSSGGDLQLTSGASGISLNNPVTNLLNLLTLDKRRATFLGGRVQTVNATITTALTRTLADNVCEAFIVYVASKRTTTANAGGYLIFGAAYRSGAGAVLIGQTAISTQETDAGNDAVLDANGNDIRVRVTGTAAQTWEWHAVMITLISNE